MLRRYQTSLYRDIIAETNPYSTVKTNEDAEEEETVPQSAKSAIVVPDSVGDASAL